MPRTSYLVHVGPLALPLVEKVLANVPDHDGNAPLSASKPVQETLRGQLGPSVIGRKYLHPDETSGSRGERRGDDVTTFEQPYPYKHKNNVPFLLNKTECYTPGTWYTEKKKVQLKVHSERTRRDGATDECQANGKQKRTKQRKEKKNAKAREKHLKTQTLIRYNKKKTKKRFRKKKRLESKNGGAGLRQERATKCDETRSPNLGDVINGVPLPKPPSSVPKLL